MGVEDADEEARDEFMPSVVVGEEPELNGGCASHVWGWQKGLDNCGDKVDQIPAESMGDDDMELFEVFHYSMEILEVKTAAGVIAALWRIATGQSVTRNETCGKETHEVAFAFYGGKTVHGGTSVRLYESGYLSCILEVD
jgi:hypothetical protein